jgi:hypothetical protein
MKNYLWTNTRINMFVICLFLAIGTCFSVANYGTLEGEIRLAGNKNRLGEYLGGI